MTDDRVLTSSVDDAHTWSMGLTPAIANICYSDDRRRHGRHDDASRRMNFIVDTTGTALALRGRSGALAVACTIRHGRLAALRDGRITNESC
jgi:hypothetical protein